MKPKYGYEQLVKEFGELSLGSLIESLRKCDEISRADYSKFLKISIKKLREFENGERIPTPKEASDFSKLLNLPEIKLVEMALNDQIRSEGLKYKVTLFDGKSR